MSASLVGSEMCIRDRNWGALQGCSIAAQMPLRHRSDASQEAGYTKYRNCLLYTSDAADDM
eukprot:14714209-Alexandrium_andersonii.AAC.1